MEDEAAIVMPSGAWGQPRHGWRDGARDAGRCRDRRPRGVSLGRSPVEV